MSAATIKPTSHNGVIGPQSVPTQLATQTKSNVNFNVGLRHSLRGLKRCSSCRTLNAQRASICRNLSCELRKRTLAMQIPFDPVQLVTKNNTDLYSVRAKERDAQPRNFVQITDVTLSLETNSAIVSRNAICFVDTCKYDGNNATNISCKHVKSCTGTKIPFAEAYEVNQEVLWNLNITLEQKQRLWNDHIEGAGLVPAVQRLNDSTFAVKCVKSQSFPAGRLHVQALSNKLSAKKGTHACACKKLKIIVEPDNSVVMEKDICDHLLLVLAAVLSKSDGKSIYGNFTNALKSFWIMPTWHQPTMANTMPVDSFFGFDTHITNGTENGSSAVDEYFIFDNDFLPSDNIPDFSDNILKSVVNLPDDSSLSFQNEIKSPSHIFHSVDPNLVSSLNLSFEDTDIQCDTISSAAATDGVDIINNNCDMAATHLELSDCNIELMDQFQQLTDQIDLCSESSDLFQTDSISILPPYLTAEDQASCIGNNSFITNELPTLNLDIAIEPALDNTNQIYNSNSLLKKNNQLNYNEGNNGNNNINCINNAVQVNVQFQQLQPPIVPAEPLPPIEMPTITVVKKEPIKAADVVTAVKTRFFPNIPAKRALIDNNKCSSKQIDRAKKTHIANVESGPALGYAAWLDYVIEIINDSIGMESNELVTHNFHIHEEVFAHFSKSFSVGVKRRMPNSSCMVKSGKYKGLIKYTWIFSNASTVQRIFTTRNSTIELERTYELSGSCYIPYVKRPPDETTKYRRIFPKLSLHVAHIFFERNNNTQNQKTGLKIEWLPNVLPKSLFGLMKIEFPLGFKVPTSD